MRQDQRASMGYDRRLSTEVRVLFDIVVPILGILGLTGVTAMSIFYGVFLTGMPFIQLLASWDQARGNGITTPKS